MEETDISINRGSHSDVIHESLDMSPAETSRANPSGIELDDLLAAGSAAEPLETRSKFRLAAILVALYLALFIAALDQTIVATAVPTIASELHSSSGYVWVMTAYLLAGAAAGPIWAKLSDIWGRKPILLSAVMFFLVSSIVCAKASSMTMLVVGRALQGTAGGGLMQLVLITISDLFSVRNRTLYLGLTEIMWAVAGGFGPILGGAFTQLATWRWCFWVNLPISGSVFFLLLFFLDVHNPQTRFLDGFKAIDWAGGLSILGLTIMLLLGLEFGGATFPWKSPQVICLIIFGILMSLVFVYSEKKLAQYPLMPLDVLSHPSNIACLLLTFFQGMVFIGGEFYLPLFFQSVRQASPLHSGILIMPITICEALMGISVGIILHRTGRYLELLRIGTVLMTIGNGLYISFSSSSSIGQVVGYQILAGLGAGMLFEPPLIALHALVSQEDTATATSTLGFVRNLGTSISIVIGGVIFQNSMDLQVPTLLNEGVSRNVTDLLGGGAASANVMIIGTIASSQQQMAVKNAFAKSLRNMWIFYTCIAACSIVASVFVSKQVLSKVHVETKTGLKEKLVPEAPQPS